MVSTINHATSSGSGDPVLPSGFSFRARQEASISPERSIADIRLAHEDPLRSNPVGNVGATNVADEESMMDHYQTESADRPEKLEEIRKVDHRLRRVPGRAGLRKDYGRRDSVTGVSELSFPEGDQTGTVAVTSSDLPDRSMETAGGDAIAYSDTHFWKHGRSIEQDKLQDTVPSAAQQFFDKATGISTYISRLNPSGSAPLRTWTSKGSHGPSSAVRIQYTPRFSSTNPSVLSLSSTGSNDRTRLPRLRPFRRA
jgi:hypothetical protein